MQFTNTEDQFKMVDDICIYSKRANNELAVVWENNSEKNLSRQHTLFAFNLDVFTLSQYKRKI